MLTDKESYGFYSPESKMADLIADNYNMLQVMSRFGISLGFGNQSVEQVCSENGVDCSTFLAVVNFVNEGSLKEGAERHISIPALLDYLKNTHSYFLDFIFPSIRKKLIEAVDCSGDEGMAFLILKCYDEYTAQVRKHMEFEESTVFGYVKELLDGKVPRDYQISIFSKHHDQVGEKLTEFKHILIKYCPVRSNVNLLSSVLFDIYVSEEGLDSHCRVEDFLFVPAILRLEKEVMENECGKGH